MTAIKLFVGFCAGIIISISFAAGVIDGAKAECETRNKVQNCTLKAVPDEETN